MIYPIKVGGKTRYLVRYRDVHSRAKQSKRFDTKDEAEVFEAALVLAKRGGVRVKRQSTQTLRAFWAEYVESSPAMTSKRRRWRATSRPGRSGSSPSWAACRWQRWHRAPS